MNIYYGGTTSASTSTWGDWWMDYGSTSNTVYVPVLQNLVATSYPAAPTAPAEFNRYVNGSDLMEEFIGWLGKEKVKQGEAMKLPVDLFVKWLIVRAAEQDGEEPGVTLALPAPSKQPRCMGCQKFLKAGQQAPMFHGVKCADFYFARHPESRP